MSNLEPIPYNQHDVLDDDAFPIIQTWTNHAQICKIINTKLLTTTSNIIIPWQQISRTHKERNIHHIYFSKLWSMELIKVKMLKRNSVAHS